MKGNTGKLLAYIQKKKLRAKRVLFGRRRTRERNVEQKFSKYIICSNENIIKNPLLSIIKIYK